MWQYTMKPTQCIDYQGEKILLTIFAESADLMCDKVLRAESQQQPCLSECMASVQDHLIIMVVTIYTKRSPS